MSDGFRIVILGGGIGGLETAITLARSRNRALQITLVDSHDRHSWKPMLHNFAAGTPIAESDTPLFTTIAKRWNFAFLQGDAVRIDRLRRRIEFANGDHLRYDILIVALGAQTDPRNIEGVFAHCDFLDTLSDAERFARRFKLALNDEAPLQIGIVGGGATGIQLTGELARNLVRARRRATAQITLIESGPRLLPSFPEQVSREAMSNLRDRGVKVLTSTTIQCVESGGFHLTDGTFLPMQLRVWAAGVRANPSTNLLGELAATPSGRISVNAQLRTADPAIFALGDCAEMAAHPLAPTAQVARQQGQYLGRALPGLAAGRTPAPFAYKHQGEVVLLGKDVGWSTFGGRLSRGLAPRLLHEALYRRHRIETLGLKRGLSASLDGSRNST